MCICVSVCACVCVSLSFKIESFLFNFKKHFTLHYGKKSFKIELEDIYCAIYVKRKAHTEIQI